MWVLGARKRCQEALELDSGRGKKFLAGSEGQEEKKRSFLKANDHGLVGDMTPKQNVNHKLPNNSFL